MKYKIHIRFDLEVDAETALNAIEEAEKILFSGNAEHPAQALISYCECRKDYSYRPESL